MTPSGPSFWNWLAIGVIAISYVSVFLLLFPGEKGSNAYGPDPKQTNVEPSAPPNAGSVGAPPASVS